MSSVIFEKLGTQFKVAKGKVGISSSKFVCWQGTRRLCCVVSCRQLQQRYRQLILVEELTTFVSNDIKIYIDVHKCVDLSKASKWLTAIVSHTHVQ